MNIHTKIKGVADGAIVTVYDPKADPGESFSPAVHRKQLMELMCYCAHHVG